MGWLYGAENFQLKICASVEICSLVESYGFEKPAIAKPQNAGCNFIKSFPMKNKTPFLLLFFVNFLFSQTTRVYYQFTYQPNKTDTLKQTELQILLFNNEKSSFQSYKQLQRDSLIAVSLEYKNKSGEFSHNDENFNKSIANQYIIETNIKEKSIQFTDISGEMLKDILEREKREIEKNNYYNNLIEI